MATSQPYSEHEKYANSADDYLDQHNVYELFNNLLRKLVVHKPKDPLSFMITALEQPVQQLRVLVVAPPSARVGTILSTLVRDLGILRLKLSTIVAEEVASGSPLGKQAKSYLDSNQDLPDQVALPLLAARTNKQDALSSGWILEGYPNTRAQALALQAGGILPTHVLYFTTSSKEAAAPVDESLAAAQEQYKRHGAAVQEVFAPVAQFVDLAKKDEQLVEQLETLFNTSPRSRAPKRPMRVVLLGPRGSGRHTQASLLAAKYGLVHVNSSALLKQEVRKIPALGVRIAQYLQNGLLVPDETLVPLVLDRLLASDAKQKGFVLEGFPRNQSQADALKKASIVPNRVVILNVSDEECRQRVSGRRLDQETGDEYQFTDAAQEAALPSAIRERLYHAPNDQAHTLEAINFAYTSFVDELKQTYGSVLREISGGEGKTKQEVCELIEDFLLAPLNNKYAHAQVKGKNGPAGGGSQEQEDQ